jgi:hypothetical protein
VGEGQSWGGNRVTLRSAPQLRLAGEVKCGGGDRPREKHVALANMVLWNQHAVKILSQSNGLLPSPVQVTRSSFKSVSYCLPWLAPSSPRERLSVRHRWYGSLAPPPARCRVSAEHIRWRCSLGNTRGLYQIGAKGQAMLIFFADGGAIELARELQHARSSTRDPAREIQHASSST